MLDAGRFSTLIKLPNQIYGIAVFHQCHNLMKEHTETPNKAMIIIDSDQNCKVFGVWRRRRSIGRL